MSGRRRWRAMEAAVVWAALVAGCGAPAQPAPSSLSAAVSSPGVTGTAPVAVAIAGQPTNAAIRPGLTVAAAQAALDDAGFVCDDAMSAPAAGQLPELTCRDEALHTDVALAGRDRPDDLRRITISVSMADVIQAPPDGPTLATRAAAASRAVGMLVPHPRDQDALAKYVVWERPRSRMPRRSCTEASTSGPPRRPSRARRGRSW